MKYCIVIQGPHVFALILLLAYLIFSSLLKSCVWLKILRLGFWEYYEK